jgi:hypothetical protein
MRRLSLFLLAACSWAALALAADHSSTPGKAAEGEGLPPLDGVLVNRPNGVIMQVKMEDLALVLRFFDAEHKPVKPDVDGGLLRAIPSGRNPERRALVPTQDGLGLTHGQPLRKPHVFKLHIALTRAGSDEAVESYTVDYP